MLIEIPAIEYKCATHMLGDGPSIASDQCLGALRETRVVGAAKDKASPICQINSTPGKVSLEENAGGAKSVSRYTSFYV